MTPEMSGCRVDASEEAPSFEVFADLDRREVRIVARGELDRAVRNRLDDLVDAVARSERSFLVDCADVSFIDAGGISSLVRAHGLGATVVGISGAVRRTLALVGLVEVLGRRAEARRTQRRLGPSPVNEAGGP